MPWPEAEIPKRPWRSGAAPVGSSGYSIYYISILYKGHIIWVNYNELTTSSLEIIVSKWNHPQMALIQVSEIL